MRENEPFRQAVARAQEERAELWADQLIEIADTDEDANRARVRIDARWKVIGSLLYRRYGVKQSIDINQNVKADRDRLQRHHANVAQHPNLYCVWLDMHADQCVAAWLMCVCVEICGRSARQGARGWPRPPWGLTTGGPALTQHPLLLFSKIPLLILKNLPKKIQKIWTKIPVFPAFHPSFVKSSRLYCKRCGSVRSWN
jgi:hypothetical protein